MHIVIPVSILLSHSLPKIEFSKNFSSYIYHRFWLLYWNMRRHLSFHIINNMITISNCFQFQYSLCSPTVMFSVDSAEMNVLQAPSLSSITWVMYCLNSLVKVHSLKMCDTVSNRTLHK
jgi:hypothetical protein